MVKCKCGVSAARTTVKKDTANKGRDYYCCTYVDYDVREPRVTWDTVPYYVKGLSHVIIHVLCEGAVSKPPCLI